MFQSKKSLAIDKKFHSPYVINSTKLQMPAPGYLRYGSPIGGTLVGWGGDIIYLHHDVYYYHRPIALSTASPLQYDVPSHLPFLRYSRETV